MRDLITEEKELLIKRTTVRNLEHLSQLKNTTGLRAIEAKVTELASLGVKLYGGTDFCFNRLNSSGFHARIVRGWLVEPDNVMIGKLYIKIQTDKTASKIQLQASIYGSKLTLYSELRNGWPYSPVPIYPGFKEFDIG